MSLRYGLATLILLSSATCDAWQAQAQTATAPSRRQTAPVSSYQAASSYQRSTGSNNAALNFYGRPRSFQYSTQSAAAPLPAPQSTAIQSPAKPFSGVQQASSMSPYLALDNFENANSLTNYFLFVRPQRDQMARQRTQQAQNSKLRQRMNAAAAAAAPYQDGATTATGHETQFMNVGGYYPGLR